MINIKDLTSRPDVYRTMMVNRNLDPNKIDELMVIYSRHKEAKYAFEQERKRKNELNKKYNKKQKEPQEQS